MAEPSGDRQWPTCGCMEACTVCIPPTCFGAPGARGQANEEGQGGNDVRD